LSASRQPIRARIEAGFADWGRVVVRWRWLAIASIGVVTLLLTSQVPELEVDNSNEAFLHGDDPERIRYDRFRAQFDPDDRLVVVVHPPEIFDLEFLARLRAFHRDIEASVPYIDEVTSLLNARNTWGRGDELVVEDLLEEWPEDEADLIALRSRVMGNPLFRNILISENGRYTTVTIKPLTYSPNTEDADVLAGFDTTGSPDASPPPFLTDLEGREIVAALYTVMDQHRAPDFRLDVVGGAVFDHAFAETMQRDAVAFMSLTLGIMAVLLLLLFRRLAGLILPTCVVVASLLSSLGIMVLLDIPFSTTLNMLPAFLITVGICDSVHLLVVVYQRFAAGDSREEAIVFALGHSGLAIAMTSITTACGVLSFYFADLAPISQLGIIAPIGVMMAMVYSLVLLPALLAVLPLNKRPGDERFRRRSGVDRFLAGMGDIATGHPIRVLVVTAVILVLGLGGIARVRFSHDGLVWFPPEDPVRIASALVDREFKGVSTLEILVHTGSENGLHEPDTLQRIERGMRMTEDLEVGGHPVNKAVSLVDVVKETNQALHANDAAFYTLPEERRLIAQELLLFENSGSDDLSELTDTRFETARVTVRTPWVDAMRYPEFIARVGSSLESILGPAATFELTGGAVLFARIFQGVILSLARSYLFAFVVITPLLVLLIGNLRQGLAAMIPNLIPVYLVLGLMGWADIPIDISTLLIGGIVLGIAVDDTIHFMHKFNRYYQQSGDARWAVSETLATTGTALLFTSLVLALGFLVYTAAYLNNVQWFGVLASFATVTAFLADVIVGPALMVLVTKPRGPSQRTVMS